MSGRRKKWRLKMYPSFTYQPVPSMRQAYDLAIDMRRQYAAALSNVHQVDVEAMHMPAGGCSSAPSFPSADPFPTSPNERTAMLDNRSDREKFLDGEVDRLTVALSDVVMALGPDRICECGGGTVDCGLRDEAAEALRVARDALGRNSGGD